MSVKTDLKDPVCCQSRQSTSIKEDDFVSMLIDFFKPYVNATEPVNEMECIQSSLDFFSSFLYKKELADIYMDFVFSLFEIFCCTNSFVIQNSLEEFFVRKLQHLKPNFRELAPPSPIARRALLQRLGKSTDDFNIEYTFYQPYVLADYELTKRLLRYSVRFEIEDDSFLYTLWKLLIPLLNKCKLNDWSGDNRVRVEKIVFGAYRKSTRLRRLYFVFLGLYPVLHALNADSSTLHFLQSFIKSLKLLFKTIPDPLISLSEVSRFFHLIKKDGSKDEEISRICSQFLTVFPQGADPVQPRSLKHLSRCVVRKNLMKAKKFPHGVWDYEVPNVVKNYILLQRTEEEFYPKYVSELRSAKMSDQVSETDPNTADSKKRKLDTDSES